MGKRLIQQRRGRGTPTYTAPSHRYLGKVSYPLLEKEVLYGEVLELVNSVGHSAPIMAVEFENGELSLLPAPEGVRVGQRIIMGKAKPEVGNILRLEDIPAGSFICNIELRPNDGGKLIRAAGSFAQVIAKEKGKVIVNLPSKKKVALNPNSFATIGVVAGGGRTTKPLVKAGRKYHIMKARNKKYPRVCGVAMNAIDHPHGGTHRRTTGRPTTRKRGLPPGKKVGLIAARRTGKRKK